MWCSEKDMNRLGRKFLNSSPTDFLASYMLWVENSTYLYSSLRASSLALTLLLPQISWGIQGSILPLILANICFLLQSNTI